MPAGRDSDDLDSGNMPPLSLMQRLRKAIVKPVASDEVTVAAAAGEPVSLEELEVSVKSADDKERLLGLLAAPFAAAIGILVITALIDHDPSAHLKNGQLNKLHVSLSLYHGLAAVLVVMSVLMLVTALLRKRLYLGIVMALYGLAVFNLHYWGFGVPFIMGGAWLLVRAYRLQRHLHEATADTTSGPGVARTAYSSSQPSKRYTPPRPARKR